MKKSKFLKNSKELLSRSFNPSKCKTSLRLAASRLKLLRNKKEAQAKQTRREISLLLESGQDQTARIRVEHVIREEKMMAAFDLIGIYCELIVARLPIIESQKICPIDLKEAIASVVYASPRCGDIPELVEVKKHFTEKYGKDFVAAAIELRPECGVSRMLVEKLSTLAPDVETKTKILRAIAEEHNVNWEAKSFEQNSLPASDLLSGPTTFVKESERPFEPSRSNHVGHRISPGAERLVSTQVSGLNSALGGEGAQFFRGDSDSIPRDRQRWKMDFKDATSAAQAAAESAELASMAARAAAELSSRGRVTRQCSTESHKSDDRSPRDGAADVYMGSKLVSELFSANISFSEHSRLQNEQMDRGSLNNSGGRFEAGRDSRKDYSHSSSLKSRASTDDVSMEHAVDRYSRKNSLNEVYRGEKRQSFKYQAENVREEKQEVFISSHSDSHSNISTIVNTFSTPKGQDFEYDGGGGIHEEASRRSSHGSAVVSDRSDSDTENYGFDRSPRYDEPPQRFQLPLSIQKTHDHLSTNTDSWSPKPSASVFLTRRSSPSEFSDRSIHGSKLDDSVAVKFDESDGQTSEFKNKSSSQYDQTQVSISSDYESEETDSERNQGKRFDADQPTLVSRKNRTELNDFGNSSREREEGLNFAKLTGGFRHKGYNYPSFTKKQSDLSPPKNESPRMLEPKNTKPDFQSTSDTDTSDEDDSLHKSLDHKHKLYNLKTKPSFAASNSMFASDNSDLVNEDQLLRRTSHLHSGMSRRTKAFPSSNHEKEKHSKLQLRSEALDHDDGREGKATTSTNSETPKRLEAKRNSSRLDNYEQQKPTSSEPQQQFQSLKESAYQSSSSKVATKTTNSNSRASLYRHSSEKADSGLMQEPKVSAKEERKTEPNLKTELLNKTSSPKDLSNLKASHVHPKLPDYDNFVQFFQKNRS